MEGSSRKCEDDVIEGVERQELKGLSTLLLPAVLDMVLLLEWLVELPQRSREEVG